MVRAALARRGLSPVDVDCADNVSQVSQTMADGARGDGDRGNQPTDEAALSARLKRLGERLGDVKASRSQDSGPAAPVKSADTSAMARGFRLSSELVGGVLMGAAIGWLLDRWLGISPWGLIAFVLLGFAAGVLNVMRAAGVTSTGGTDPR
jgi:ATP synthase protein I